LKISLKLLVLAIIVWVSISSASILVILSKAPAEACAFWRLLISALILHVIGFYRDGNIRSIYVVLKRFKWYHLVASLGLASHFILWMKSLFLIPVYISTLLVTLYPLYSLLGEIAILRYKPPPSQVLGLVSSIVLLVLFLRVENLIVNEGAILALLGGVAAAIYFEVGSYARGNVGEDVVTYASHTYLLSSVLVLIYSLISNITLFNYPPSTYMYFILLAVIPMLFGHTVINYVLAHYPASLITMIALGEPFGAGLLAYLVLGQSLEPQHLLYGVALIFTVLITLTKSTRRKG